MPAFSQLSSAQLRQALQLREQIDSLQAQLAALLDASESNVPTKAKAPTGGKAQTNDKRTMSPEGRARIAAGAKARWAKIKDSAASSSNQPAAAKTQPKKATGGGITPERRAKLSAAMKASWAAKRAVAAGGV